MAACSVCTESFLIGRSFRFSPVAPYKQQEDEASRCLNLRTSPSSLRFSLRSRTGFALVPHLLHAACPLRIQVL